LKRSAGLGIREEGETVPRSLGADSHFIISAHFYAHGKDRREEFEIVASGILSGVRRMRSSRRATSWVDTAANKEKVIE